MDIIAIQDNIEALENSDTTFDNVKELALLYIVRDKLKTHEIDVVQTELADILPAYNKYCNTKRKYQLDEVTEGAVIKDLKLVCKEIQEFIHTLYTHTDMRWERKLLIDMISTISKTYQNQ